MEIQHSAGSGRVEPGVCAVSASQKDPCQQDRPTVPEDQGGALTLEGSGSSRSPWHSVVNSRLW